LPFKCNLRRYFVDEEGWADDHYPPRFNTLVVFEVPRRHAVEEVWEVGAVQVGFQLTHSCVLFVLLQQFSAPDVAWKQMNSYSLKAPSFNP
jgi:hypothetical protein